MSKASVTTRFNIFKATLDAEANIHVKLRTLEKVSYHIGKISNKLDEYPNFYDGSDYDVELIYYLDLIEEIYAYFSGGLDLPGGSTTFVDLIDTPANMSNMSGKLLKVNSAENAIEFSNILETTQMKSVVRNSTVGTLNQYKIVKTDTIYNTEIPNIVYLENIANDKPIGILATDVLTDTTSKIVTYGLLQVNGFNTASANIGDKVYVDDNGDLTLSSGNLSIGRVASLSANGVIFFDFSTNDSTEFENMTETSSKTFYISPTGNDSTGDGSIGNPYLTINPAKNSLKPIIKTDINFIYVAGNHTIGKDDFDFSRFTIDTTFTQYFWIAGSLNQIETTSLTNTTNWYKTDATKTWTDDEHKGRFLSTSDDASSFPTLKPIFGNNATVLKSGYGAVGGAYTPNQIVELTTILTLPDGNKLEFQAPNSSDLFKTSIYFNYMNLDSGNDTLLLQSNDDLGKISISNNYILNADDTQSITINGRIDLTNNYLELRGRIYNANEFVRNIFIDGNAFHMLMPRNLGENIPIWFDGSFFDVRNEMTFGYQNSFQYFQSVLAAGYFDNLENLFEVNRHFHVENCGCVIETRGQCSIEFKGATDMILVNTPYFIWHKYGTSNMHIKADLINLNGTLPTKEWVTPDGSATWDFDYDAGDGNVSHNIPMPKISGINSKYTSLPRHISFIVPNVYPENSPEEILSITNGNNSDVVIGNLDNRSIFIRLNAENTGNTEACVCDFIIINIDDTTISLQNNTDLTTVETDSNLTPQLSGSGGIIFTTSVSGNNLILNINNDTGLDIDIKYIINRTFK